MTKKDLEYAIDEIAEYMGKYEEYQVIKKDIRLPELLEMIVLGLFARTAQIGSRIFPHVETLREAYRTLLELGHFNFEADEKE